MTYQARYKKGDRIGGHYLVHQAILGGMGEVYLCLNEQEALPIALKTFQGSDQRMRKIFEKEVEHWIALDLHPHIVKCEWMQTLDNIPFMGLEWIAGDGIHGTDLRSWLRFGALKVDLALSFTIDICRGLKYANEKVQGIVHRDLKPENVLVNQSRNAKITDFGLATIAHSAGLQSGTQAEDEENLGRSQYRGHIVGTPLYMAPEQWRGEEETLDFRTDMYAVACILYELLTGKWIYTGSTINELKIKHTEASLPNLAKDIPAPIIPTLEQCLAKKQTDRFESLDVLIAELSRAYETVTGEVIRVVAAQGMIAMDYNNRGMTYTNLGDNHRAIEDFNKATELDPNSALLYANRAVSNSNLGNKRRAIEDCDKAIKLDPNFAPAYANRAGAYGDLGDKRRAIEDCDKAIKLDPNYATAYNNRGNNYADLGEHRRAIVDLDKAIELNPYYAIAYGNRGRSYGDLGEHRRAIADLTKAIEFNPNYAVAYMNRGLNFGRLGDTQRAVGDFDKAIELAPDHPGGWFNKGILLLNIGLLQESLTHFEKAYQLGFQPAFDMIRRIRRALGL